MHQSFQEIANVRGMLTKKGRDRGEVQLFDAFLAAEQIPTLGFLFFGKFIG